MYRACTIWFIAHNVLDKLVAQVDDIFGFALILNRVLGHPNV